MADDPIVLDYHNSLLRKSDVDLLDEPNWINDTIIGFAFEYFEKEQFSHCVDLIGYLGPSVTQAIKLTPENEGVCIFLDPLELEVRHYVFMAVNDQMSANSHGGSHWSLLVYDRNVDEFHHYDSLYGMNRNAAMSLAEKIFTYFEEKRKEKESSDKNKDDSQQENEKKKKLSYKEKVCPQQENGYDCGMHVIVTCEHLIRNFVEACMISLDVANSLYSISTKRQKFKELIYQLKS